MRFAYVFDDYAFLGKAQRAGWSDLLPNPGDVLYRPVSRELYFGFLERVSPGRPAVGHVINAILVAAIIVLLGSLVSRLVSPRAGPIAAFLIAAFGQLPVLIAWVSGVQDLLAIAFSLFSIHLLLRGHQMDALVMLALAILSKETAVVVAPALIAIQWYSSRDGRKVLALLVQASLLVLAWALLHPGVRALIAHHGMNATGTYIGLNNPNRWDAVLQSIPGLLNLPLIGDSCPWPHELNRILGLALAPFAAIVLALRPREAAVAPERRVLSVREAVTVGLLFGIPPLVLTCFIVRHWAPYYLCFPAIGLSVALAPLLARVRYHTLIVLLSIYLVGGVWTRGAEMKPGVPTERGLEPAGRALRTLESNFMRVAPSLPKGSIVYVTVMATGVQSVYIHLHTLQVLRVWYHDPAIQTLRPELQVLSNAPQSLLWVDPGLNVFQVDLSTLTVKSSGPPVDPRRRLSVMRSYAIGVGEVGDLQRAVDILLHLDPPDTWDYAISYRMAAALLYAHAQDAVADEMLAGVPELPRGLAFVQVGMILTIPTRATHLEEPALRAFGLSWQDPSVIRKLLEALMGLGYYEVSGRLAERLLVLVPGDNEATAALAKIKAVQRRPERIIPPVRGLDGS